MIATITVSPYVTESKLSISENDKVLYTPIFLNEGEEMVKSMDLLLPEDQRGVDVDYSFTSGMSAHSEVEGGKISFTLLMTGNNAKIRHGSLYFYKTREWVRIESIEI